MEVPPSPGRRRPKKKHLVLAAVVLAGTALAVVIALKYDVRAAFDAVIVGLREAGPAIFFTAMAILPAIGFPLIAFTLSAGPVFGPTLGAGWVVVWSLVAVFANLLLTYWLATRAFRPIAHRVLNYFEVRLPQASASGAWQVALIVRLTPGPPYWLQSYLLGLIRVPLVPYLVVSMFVMTGFIIALVAGGGAIAQGNGRLALMAAGVFAASVAALQLVRKHVARRVVAVTRD